MKSLFLKLSLLLLFYFAIQVCSVSAASLEYATFVSTDPSSNSFVIKYGGLEDKNYYNCTITTMLCGQSAEPGVSSVSTTMFNYSTELRGVSRIMTKGHSSDGRFIYYYQYTDADHPYRRYVLIDTKTEAVYAQKTPVPFLDLITEQNRVFSISPDDQVLFYIDDREGAPAIYRVNLLRPSKTMMAGERITKKTYTVADFIAYDKTNVYFIANRSNPLKWSLYHYNTATEELSQVAENVSYSDPIKKVGNTIVFLQIKGNTVVPVTYDPTKNILGYFSLPQTAGLADVVNSYTVVNYGSLWGTLMYPDADIAKDTAHPLIIWLHGGPYRQSSLTLHPYFSYGVYDWILQEARNNGAVVLKLDYSGSYGYGSKFISSLKENIGKRDVNDVISALKKAKIQVSKKIPISKVYLMGNSYGGYLAVRSLVAYPSTFAGAFSINGVMDWPTLLEDLENSLFNSYFNGLPNPKNRSLFSKADILQRYGDVLPGQKITLIQAAQDATINPAQANILKYSWAPSGVDVNVVSISGEDHVFHKSSSITAICGSLFQFLDIATSSPDTCVFH